MRKAVTLLFVICVLFHAYADQIASDSLVWKAFHVGIQSSGEDLTVELSEIASNVTSRVFVPEEVWTVDASKSNSNRDEQIASLNVTFRASRTVSLGMEIGDYVSTSNPGKWGPIDATFWVSIPSQKVRFRILNEPPVDASLSNKYLAENRPYWETRSATTLIDGVTATCRIDVTDTTSVTDPSKATFVLRTTVNNSRQNSNAKYSAAVMTTVPFAIWVKIPTEIKNKTVYGEWRAPFTLTVTSQ